jgi:hypothetical protein
MYVRRVKIATGGNRLHPALALLVMAALSHCSWEDGREVVLRVQTAAGQQLGRSAPWQSPVHDCSHESSCICRGATIASPTNVAGLAADATHELLPGDGGTLAMAAAEGLPVRLVRASDTLCPAAFSGRQLRALYASLVI